MKRDVTHCASNHDVTVFLKQMLSHNFQTRVKVFSIKRKMRFTNAALFAFAAAAAAFDAVSNVAAFAPAIPLASNMATFDAQVAPSSSTELQMGLRSFLSRKIKGTQSASSSITKDEVRALFRCANDNENSNT